MRLSFAIMHMAIHISTVGDGLVAFKLVGLPDTNGKTVPLTLKWKSFSGDKSAVFDYCTQKPLHRLNRPLFL